MPEINSFQNSTQVLPKINSSPEEKYLNQDRAVNVRQKLNELDKKEKSGLKNIEIRDKPKELGKDDFLKILITQLSYQDPTSPLQDQQFIAQMAQFSTLEQMQNMTASLNKLSIRQAQDMIGRFVVGKDFVSGENVTGVVQAVFYDDKNKGYLKVGGRAISVDEVQLVGDPNLLLKDRDINANSNTSTNRQNVGTPSNSSDTKHIVGTPTSNPDTNKQNVGTPTGSYDTKHNVGTPTSSPDTNRQNVGTPTSSPDTKHNVGTPSNAININAQKEFDNNSMKIESKNKNLGVDSKNLKNLNNLNN